MHTSAMDEPSTGRRRRVVPATLAVPVLLAVVALASQGGTPLGTGGARRPSDRLLDYVVSGFLALMAVGVVGIALLFLAGRDAMREVVLQRKRRSPALGVVVLALVLIAMAVSSVTWGETSGAAPGVQTGSRRTTGTNGAASRATTRVHARAGADRHRTGRGAGVALLAAARARRGRGRARRGDLAEAIGDVSETPTTFARSATRAAVIRAHAPPTHARRVRLPPAPAEAPHEYPSGCWPTSPSARASPASTLYEGPSSRSMRWLRR